MDCAIIDAVFQNVLFELLLVSYLIEVVNTAFSPRNAVNTRDGYVQFLKHSTVKYYSPSI